MTTSDTPVGAFVWIWLPNASEPTVAGRLERGPDGRLLFAYGRTYLAKPNAISLYAPELPLRRGTQAPPEGLQMPSCLRDASPDAWGRRVILNRLAATAGATADPAGTDELTFLLESGSDRIGALDFQVSATEYIAREREAASLDELLAAAEMIQRGLPLTEGLAAAVQHGTSIGGARPKALITDGTRKLIAKFSATTDTHGVVEGEFLAMRLAALAGIRVAPVEMTAAAGKRVLLIERFDRERIAGGWRRRAMVSALTILGLDETWARYASYEDLAERVKISFTRPEATLLELFERIVWNVLVANTDDHARNHAAFWDGETLSLTPAYDICPQPRTGGEATQAMLIHGTERLSRISTCLSAMRTFRLSEPEALDVVEAQIGTIRRWFHDVCDDGEVPPVDRALFARQFLPPYAFEDLEGGRSGLRRFAGQVRTELARHVPGSS